MAWLAWDTDDTDLDLHVIEPTGNLVSWEQRKSNIGGRLSRDFQEGYGPEVYVLKHAMPGKYVIRAQYFATHQQSTITGATSAVVWVLRGLDGNSEGEMDFDTVRLDTG